MDRIWVKNKDNMSMELLKVVSQIFEYILFIAYLFQMLRQLLDERVLCTLQKPFESRIVEGLTIFSAMALTDYPAISTRQLSERLLVRL